MEPKKILAIDNASRLIGWAFYYGKELDEYGHINLSKHGTQADSRILAYYKVMTELIETYGPSHVVIESPGGGGTGWSLRVLSEFLGILKLICLKKRIPFSLISPTEAKKGATGKGNASKKEVQKWAYKAFPEVASKDMTEDEADAIAIGFAYLQKK